MAVGVSVRRVCRGGSASISSRSCGRPPTSVGATGAGWCWLRWRWARCRAWTTAGLVGWERIRLDAHWASDIVAGGILGTSIGRFVVRRNHPDALEARRLELAPLVGDKSWGLDLRWSL